MKSLYRILICFTITSVVITPAYSQAIAISMNYRGITNNPKVLNEGLRLNSDKSYSFKYAIYDVGSQASKVEYVGKYAIENDQLVFSLDTIKSFNTRVYKRNEKRDDSPYSNYQTSIADSIQKETFAEGGFRLKPKYSIDKNHKVITLNAQERFVAFELPEPKVTELETEMRREVEKLNQERNLRIKELVKTISTNCSLNESGSLLLRLIVKPNGFIDSYELLDFNEHSQKGMPCVDDIINKDFRNLGEIKIIPNARNGSRPRSITYTLLIK